MWDGGDHDETQAKQRQLYELSKHLDENKLDLLIPEPMFVLKTQREDDDVKVFINFCQSTKIAPPSIQEIGTKAQTLPDIPTHGLKIPLSLSEAKLDNDDAGRPCIVYDVVFNPATIQEAKDSIEYRDSVVELALSYIKQKYNVPLSSAVSFPTNIAGNYKGEQPTIQTIRDDSKKSIIEELAEQKETQQQSFCLSHEITHLTESKIQVVVCFARLETAKNLIITAREDGKLIISDSSDIGLSYSIDMGVLVKEEDGEAKFDKKRKKLTIVFSRFQHIPPKIDERTTEVKEKTEEKKEEDKGFAFKFDKDITPKDERIPFFHNKFILQLLT